MESGRYLRDEEIERMEGKKDEVDVEVEALRDEMIKIAEEKGIRALYDAMPETPAGVKKPYKGRVVRVAINCNCELCQRGAEQLKALGKEPPLQRVHIEIQPLDTYEKNQHEWLDMTVKAKQTRYGVFLGYLIKADPEVNQLKDMIGRVYVWEQDTVANLYKKLTGKDYTGNRPEAIVQVPVQRVE